MVIFQISPKTGLGANLAATDLRLNWSRAISFIGLTVRVPQGEPEGSRKSNQLSLGDLTCCITSLFFPYFSFSSSSSVAFFVSSSVFFFAAAAASAAFWAECQITWGRRNVWEIFVGSSGTQLQRLGSAGWSSADARTRCSDSRQRGQLFSSFFFFVSSLFSVRFLYLIIFRVLGNSWTGDCTAREREREREWWNAKEGGKQCEGERAWDEPFFVFS